LKILHIIAGLNKGGAEAVLIRLVTADQQMGNQHYVLSLMDRGIFADQLEQVDAKVYALNFPRGRVTLNGLVQLFRLVRQIHPDVVQTWMYHADLIGGFVARLAGVRAIAWGVRHANLDLAYNSRSTLVVVRLCALLSAWVPRLIISCSAEATRVHQAVGYSDRKFVQIPNGYNLSHLQPDLRARAAIRAELGFARDVFVLGMVARFDAQKDHHNLVQALGILKRRGVSFVCVLAGLGLDRNNTKLTSWLTEACVIDSVRLLGPRSDVPALMNALDVHVLSSMGEAFPNVLAEAMACGTPCVTTDVGDASIIVGGYGWVVAPQNSDALANSLELAYSSFVSDPVGWRLRQAACRSHIMTNFDLDQMCQRFRQAWQRCIQA
jgi:glycosyltransferase involved in cell wall biosynthesis